VTAARGLAILATLCLSSCVTFVWTRERRFEPLRKDALEGLENGRTTFAACLERLGAPLYVWEYKIDGAAIAWGAADEDSKRIAVTIPLTARYNPTFSYGDIDAKLRGAVLFFDHDLVLERVERGCLRDLQRQIARPRPAAPPPEAQGL
jgi:hypothetical protein